MSNYSELLGMTRDAIRELYGHDMDLGSIVVNQTKKEFEGEYTIVTFPLAKVFREKPNVIAEKIGIYLCTENEDIQSYNVKGGFVNLSMSNSFWHNKLKNFDIAAVPVLEGAQKIMIEYSSPNTNKPLHMGHIRNILLGWSCAKIYEYLGYEVIKTQVFNDRGIAICKSMLAWDKYGQGETPESAEMKSDHLVGKYYVLFDQKFMEEYEAWQETEQAQKIFQQQDELADPKAFFKDYKQNYFNRNSSLGAEVKEMLRQWENGDAGTLALWNKMNNWVYAGYDITYKKLGVEFDISYHESNTYLLGKEVIDQGLKEGVFYRKEDGSVWADLTDIGMDEKLVLRSDGTSLYMTQDLGTAQKRYAEYGFNKMVYVVGDEQDYHFQVLFELLKRLKEPYAEHLYHLSYGMIDLPTGRMKSREGTIVDADDLIQEVIDIARHSAKERGEIMDLSKRDQQEIINRIALGALKFFIIKVNPLKRMVFNPEESMDMQGQTGPYVQNAFVRIKSILRKAGDVGTVDEKSYVILDEERHLISLLIQFRTLVEQAAENYDPSSMANYAYALAKAFHKFYHDIRVLNAESEEAKRFRIYLIKQIADTLEQAFDLLGIKMPQRM